MITTDPPKVQDLWFAPANIHLAILPLLLFSLVALASCQTYYIVDAKYGRSIVAGDRYDGHTDPSDRPNAKWILEPVDGEPDFFWSSIRDTKYWRCIVAVWEQL